MRHVGDAETERLRLERWSHSAHRDGFAAMNAQPDVLRYIGGGEPLSRVRSEEASRRFAAHWDSYGFGLWAAVERESGAMVGFVGLAHPLWWPAMVERVEVGWRLRRESWGAGYATEGARVALRIGFEQLGLREIVSFVHPQNERSLAVARRLGMRETAELPHPTLDERVKVLAIAAPER